MLVACGKWIPLPPSYDSSFQHRGWNTTLALADEDLDGFLFRQVQCIFAAGDWIEREPTGLLAGVYIHTKLVVVRTALL